ncbi:MAG TPA: 4-hydroxy-tetrahydrodipicolinate reductase [Spirochaetota bacterium]|nr:4-hydroxy-tetrahydrodipicolinate reductase [Spirochaetota bacterium]
MSEKNVVIVGAAGRMGRKNLSIFSEHSSFKVSGAVEQPHNEYIGQDISLLTGGSKQNIKVSSDISVLLDKADIVIDFSHPRATLPCLQQAADARVPCIIGTTGFSSADMKIINKAAASIAVVLSGNYSTGINLLLGLVEKAAAAVSDFDVEIIEHHHNQKIDAPSGTAAMLAREVCKSRNLQYEKTVNQGRCGSNVKRGGPQAEIGIAAVRAGGIIGEHQVILAGKDEKIEINHSALNRRAFTSGVVQAALWLTDKPPALYSMRHVLGFA